MLFVPLMLACQDQELQAEVTRLTAREQDLKRALDRAERDLAAQKARAERLEKEVEAARKAKLLSSLGLQEGRKLVATFVTSMGDVECVLRADEAPETVLNFVQLARGDKEWTDPRTNEKTRAPLYDGTIFHRVIPDFMIQGGDPLGNGTGDPGYRFADEVGDFTVFDHPGILAMANSGPDTNGSQFFITEGTPTHLNGKHSILGDCEDLEVVAKIARVPRDGRDKPKQDVVLRTVRVTTR